MAADVFPAPLLVEIGTYGRPGLLAALEEAGVQLNASARTLLDSAIFDHPVPESVTLVDRSLLELGLPSGAPLPQILATAQERDLHPCPPMTAPYLRLAWLEQPSAPDSILSNGRAPTGSLTVAAVPPSLDDGFPKGFYLRVVDGQPWLRGYRCDSAHDWSPADRFLFAI